jgi:hypothetical protein
MAPPHIKGTEDMKTNNANKSKRNIALLLFLPLAACALVMQPKAHAGTITVSGFSPKTEQHVLLKAEESLWPGLVGWMTAKCSDRSMRVSQVAPLFRVNALLVHECPGRNLSVTFKRPPNLAGAAILKHP